MRIPCFRFYSLFLARCSLLLFGEVGSVILDSNSSALNLLPECAHVSTFRSNSVANLCRIVQGLCQPFLISILNGRLNHRYPLYFLSLDFATSDSVILRKLIALQIFILSQQKSSLAIMSEFSLVTYNIEFFSCFACERHALWCLFSDLRFFFVDRHTNRKPDRFRSIKRRNEVTMKRSQRSLLNEIANWRTNAL